MDLISPYMAMDRRQAMINGQQLPERTAGAAIFADISGFTPLAESLVNELGRRRGPEELARQVNDVYDALIAELYRYRGSVISFAGDAITCWIDKDDGRMATAAGLAMLNVMTQFQEVRTPSGRIVSLGLKIAIVTGPVRRFVVGDPEIFLLEAMTGETLERMAAAEQEAERGDLIVDENTVGAFKGPPLPVKEWRMSGEAGERFAVIDPQKVPDLHVPPDPWPEFDPDALSEADKASWVLPPVYRRLTRGLGEFLAEIRPVVAIFIRFSGIDYDNDPDAPLRLDTFIREIQHILARYDGNLLQVTIGDKGSYLYISFGAPIVHEDDPTRAAAAALRLNEIAAELPYIDDMQIGLTIGPLRTGSSGSSTRRTYVALGDTVNLAARLMIAAQPGQILASDELREATGHSFLWETLPAVKVKGKKEAVPLSRLVGQQRVSREDRTQRPAADLPPMVGREAERDLILNKLDLVLEGKGQILTVTAEAGMGKSRLAGVATDLAQQKGMTVLTGEAQSYGSQSSYLVWQPIWQHFFGMNTDLPEAEQIERLEETLRLIDPDLVGRLPLLGAVARLSIPDNDLTAYLDAKVRKTSLEDLLLRCLQIESVLEPYLIVLDDMHWIDPLSEDLLQVLVRGITNLPVMMMLVRRPPDGQMVEMEEMRLPNAIEINLTEFTAEESQELVQYKLSQYYGDTPPSPLLVERINSQAGGNPFYIEEILNYFYGLNIDPQDDEAIQQVDLPQSIHSLVLSRIDQLAENQQLTLKIASVIGRTFLAATLFGVYPQSPDYEAVRADLNALTSADLTNLDTPEPELQYLFKHVITHEVAYESLLYSTRAMLHEQIGLYIERSYGDRINIFTNTLAFHFSRSENEEKKRIYLLEAGYLAQKQFSNKVAIRFFNQALPLLEGRERIDVRLNLGKVYELTANFDEALVQYELGLQEAQAVADIEAIGRSQTAHGELARKKNSFDEATDWFAKAQQTFQGLEPQVKAKGIGQVLHFSGTLAAQQGQYELANDRYSESLALRRSLGDRENEANVLNNLGIVARYLGDAAASRSYNEEALQIQEELGNRWTTAALLNNLGQMALDNGQFDDARKQFDQALITWREIGAGWATTNTIHNLANVSREEGDLDGARELYLEAAERWQDLGDKWGLAYWLEDVAILFALQAGQSSEMPQRAGQAMQLLALASKLREEIGSPRPPSYNERLEERLTPALEQLGEAGRERAEREGEALTVEQAVALL